MLSVYVEHLIHEFLEKHGGKLISVMEPSIRAIVQAAIDQERERIIRLVSAERCPECRAGQLPTYDEYWKAWYHGQLLCLGSTARLAALHP